MRPMLYGRRCVRARRLSARLARALLLLPRWGGEALDLGDAVGDRALPEHGRAAGDVGEVAGVEAELGLEQRIEILRQAMVDRADGRPAEPGSLGEHLPRHFRPAAHREVV